MSFKEQVYQHCLKLLEQKTEEYYSALRELASGIENDAKSSAGDKHETARAMMQQEQEKIMMQLSEIKVQSESLLHINIHAPSIKIHTGSLVKTDKGFLFLAVAIGKLVIDGTTVIILCGASPSLLRQIKLAAKQKEKKRK